MNEAFSFVDEVSLIHLGVVGVIGRIYAWFEENYANLHIGVLMYIGESVVRATSWLNAHFRSSTFPMRDMVAPYQKDLGQQYRTGMDGFEYRFRGERQAVQVWVPRVADGIGDRVRHRRRSRDEGYLSRPLCSIGALRIRALHDEIHYIH